jgi:hypothetical protein
MWRNLKRYYGAGDLHFITCSCYRRQPLLGTARRRDFFLTVLEQVRRRYEFVVGYVVMPDRACSFADRRTTKEESFHRDAGPQTRLCAARPGAGATAAQPVASPSLRLRAATHLAETVLRFQRLERTQSWPPWLLIPLRSTREIKFRDSPLLDLAFQFTVCTSIADVLPVMLGVPL